MENANEDQDEHEYKTRKVLDNQKLVEELERWHRKAYHMNKLDFILIGYAFAVAPILLPLWIIVSLARHFSGKNLWKTEEYKVVGEE